MPKRFTMDEFVQLASEALAEMRSLNGPDVDAPLARWLAALQEAITERKSAEPTP